jgi:phosphoglucosamine mutase
MGGKLFRTRVGDRYVVEAMRQKGAVMGGEQSGHLIFMDYSTTGDGILAGIRLLKIMLEKNRTLSELSALLTLFPQKLINVHVERKIPFDQVNSIQKAVTAAQKSLGDKGRILLRYSGTEPVARVMVEGDDEALVSKWAADLAWEVEQGLKLGY